MNPSKDGCKRRIQTTIQVSISITIYLLERDQSTRSQNDNLSPMASGFGSQNQIANLATS
jgi:hypothetical protein